MSPFSRFCFHPNVVGKWTPSPQGKMHTGEMIPKVSTKLYQSFHLLLNCPIHTGLWLETWQKRHPYDEQIHINNISLLQGRAHAVHLLFNNFPNIWFTQNLILKSIVFITVSSLIIHDNATHLFFSNSVFMQTDKIIWCFFHACHFWNVKLVKIIYTKLLKTSLNEPSQFVFWMSS